VIQDALDIRDNMIQFVFIEVPLRQMPIEIRKVFLRVTIALPLIVIAIT